MPLHKFSPLNRSHCIPLPLYNATSLPLPIPFPSCPIPFPSCNLIPLVPPHVIPHSAFHSHSTKFSHFLLPSMSFLFHFVNAVHFHFTMLLSYPAFYSRPPLHSLYKQSTDGLLLPFPHRSPCSSKVLSDPHESFLCFQLMPLSLTLASTLHSRCDSSMIPM